jgi:ABC-type Fe3+ transport system permease subunit
VSYYNFNDHFWSPQTVCSQSELPKLNKKSTRRKTLTSILTLVCLVVWTPLFFQIVVPGVHKNQETSSNLEASNFHGDWARNSTAKGDRLSKREHFLFYLFVQQR